ncbi:MAG: hydroxymethylglutaryl-CoA lyase [Pyrinomonadaceae bacterium]|nr:hydroxymethylglutaryl-CoA lyase [Sphingobacteriaceae bacterium]
MISSKALKLIECPRDAMQGLSYFIPTEDKITYLNLLLNVGFDTLDFGSFVSPAIVPQMADTREVLNGLDTSKSHTKLLAIVANSRGIDEALQHSAIHVLGYPFSISETFQKRNTNRGITESLSIVEDLLNQCSAQKNKEVVIYLSMAFGNPYGDTWNEHFVISHCAELVKRGVKTIALSDTTGESTPASVTNIFQAVSSSFPEIELGVHLHSTPSTWKEKIEAAYFSGCRRFDSALKGYGGCPMASDKLTGNIATENLLDFLSKKEDLKLDLIKFNEAMKFAETLFH